MSFVQAKPAAAHDIYGLIHKGLRLALTELLVRLGRVDPADPAETAALITDLRLQGRLSLRHMTHEDREIHPALEARCPGAAGRLRHSHEDHRAALAEIEVLLDAVQAGGDPAQWRRLYLRFSQVVADDLAHMAEEELVVLPVLQGLFTDAELVEIHQRILASVEPADMAAYVRVMIGAGSHADRLGLLREFKAAAPPEAYAAIIEAAVRPQMTEGVWRTLAEALAA